MRVNKTKIMLLHCQPAISFGQAVNTQGYKRKGKLQQAT